MTFVVMVLQEPRKNSGWSERRIHKSKKSAWFLVPETPGFCENEYRLTSFTSNQNLIFLPL